MIKLQLNKYKIISLIKIVETIVKTIQTEREQLRYSTKRMELAAHLYTMQELSRKARGKFISVEHKPDMQRFVFSVTPMQAYVFVLYKDKFTLGSGYDIGSMYQLADSMFQHLLN